jgi:hypothetical protein
MALAVPLTFPPDGVSRGGCSDEHGTVAPKQARPQIKRNIHPTAFLAAPRRALRGSYNFPRIASVIWTVDAAP